MDGVDMFFWLAGQALEVTVFFPPTAALFLLGGIGAFLSVCEVPRNRWHHTLACLVVAIIQIAVPVAILLCGVLFAHDTELDEVAPRWPEWLVAGLLMSHLPLATALVALLRGARLFTLTMSVAIFGYSCGAAFMSTMAVSGRWL